MNVSWTLFLVWLSLFVFADNVFSLGDWPADNWKTSSPEAQGMSSAKLLAISPEAIGNAVVIRNGYEVWTWGDPARRYSNWASVTRSYLTTAWGMAIQDGSIAGGLNILEQPVRNLASVTAKRFSDDVRLKHLLSYTSCRRPAGSRWSYSCGQDWFDQYRIFRELTGRSVHDYLNKSLFPVLGGETLIAIPTDSDRGETSRVAGSARDHARWGYLWLNRGYWQNKKLVDPVFVERSIHPGPDGDGPDMNEGWQIHLSTDGKMVPGCPRDVYFAYGGLDRAVIFGSRSLNLVVARWISNQGSPIEEWMGQICQAVQKTSS
jgi:CubicO group peptidase (beta-lactamase class C family)